MLDKIAKELADQILALIAPELEKAAKWDKLQEEMDKFHKGFSDEDREWFKQQGALNQPEVKPSPNGRGR